jgi:flavodoxin
MNTEAKGADKINASRRNLLKLAVTGLFAGVADPVLLHLSNAHAALTGAGRQKVLTIYFSRSGNTREIANQIHEIVGGKIVELETVKPYPDEYNAVTKQAKEELNSGYKPPLKTKVKNIGAYDVIFVGSPNWWSTIASPVRTFLSEYDLSGKTIAPFITHAGSRLGRSTADISMLCPKSTILDGLAIWGKDAKNAQNEVSAWVRVLGVKA